MGLFETIFRPWRRRTQADGFFKMLTGYSPVWASASEKIYEYEIIRASIHTFASHCSKLNPELLGSARRDLEDTIQFKPNPYMDTAKFLYRLATILSVNNTAFILPLEDASGTITGYYPLLPQFCEVVEVQGQPYLRYTFANGDRAAIEFSKVGILNQHQYSEEFFGDDNKALNGTLRLLHTQNEGIVTAVKNSALVRFLAKISNVLNPEDIDEERENFSKRNLSSENKSGLVIWDNKFSELTPLESKPYTINAEQMKLINTNVYNYFGINEAILQNKFDEEGWNAYYNGKIATFARQLSLVISNMTFTTREIAHGNRILFTENLLLHASNQTKLQISTQLFDRSLVTVNEIRDIWGLSHFENGDERFIRKEYAKLEDLGKEFNLDANNEDTGIQGNGAAADAGTGGAHQEV